MVAKREPTPTTPLLDRYCSFYQDIFENDVRSFEHFKFLQMGILSDIKRKSLPSIAEAVGVTNGQALHHFIANSFWNTASLRNRREEILFSSLEGKEITLCIDETGDEKKGRTTDYVARQYIGNLGKIANGIVTVHAVGVYQNVTFPLGFEVYKPQSRLKENDAFQTKIQIAIHLVTQCVKKGLIVSLVVADALYGEASDFISCLETLQLDYIVGVRSNHGVWMPKEQPIVYTPWRKFKQNMSGRKPETRYVREIIYGSRHARRYFEITTDKENRSSENTWNIMTNKKEGDSIAIAKLYKERGWIETTFRNAKTELGWKDYRFTDYSNIERWWENVLCAYLLVSLRALFSNSLIETPTSDRVSQKENISKGWKFRLHQIRFLLLPLLCLGLLRKWISYFNLRSLYSALGALIGLVNSSFG